jgi:hypothetical protein
MGLNAWRLSLGSLGLPNGNLEKNQSTNLEMRRENVGV